MKQKGLIVREWVAVFVMLLILITLTAASFASKGDQLAPSVITLTIQVIGAVREEQRLLLPTGALVVDALTHLELTENADIGKLALNMKLQPNQTLVIPTKGKISIFVTGAVEKRGLTLIPEECRYPDLLGYLVLKEDVDVKQFKRRRRLLREGETVIIASKN